MDFIGRGAIFGRKYGLYPYKIIMVINSNEKINILYLYISAFFCF